MPPFDQADFFIISMSLDQTKIEELLKKLTGESGLAVIIADENSTAIAESNNNSMCRALSAAPEFAPCCAEFCGRVSEMTAEAEKAVEYECYAGLSCSAIPFETGEKRLTAIVGRTFLKAANYRQATERAISGDWNKFPPSEFFENVLLTGSNRVIEKLGKKIEGLSGEEKALFAVEEPKKIAVNDENMEIPMPDISSLIEHFHQKNTPQIAENKGANVQKKRDEAGELAVWRSLFSSLLKLDYRQACDAILDFLGKRYGLRSMMWLERRENRFETIRSTGTLLERKVEIGVAVDDERLLDAARRESVLELRERRKDDADGERQTISLFPVAVGGEIRSALVIGDDLSENRRQKRLAHFCRTVATELEILRLREEISRRDWITKSVGKFNESLKKIDSEDFWINLTQICAEMLRAERASLLIFDEQQQTLKTEAAVGSPAFSNAERKIGERIAQKTLDTGKPLIAESPAQIGLPAAPDGEYKTDSFIVYPITIGERKLAALNFTDRAGGESFNQYDLELLEAITPQIAVAIDRAGLKNKAGEMEQRSVTDALTGLLNRRYLEERLIEEIKRSNRYGYPMSFVMIDVDEFGKFNKDFGVLVGDEVLRQTVKAMVSTLRGADIAARYGGEEFCVLLPQTTLSEALMIAERIRQSVENIRFPQRQITISVGVTTFTFEVSTPEQIIKTSDIALRAAKQSGKNNVQVFGDLSENSFIEINTEQHKNLS